MRSSVPMLVGRELSARDLAAREITIMGDKSLPYDVLKKVMATCTDADYGRISLAVLQKEKPYVAGPLGLSAFGASSAASPVLPSV